MRPYFLQPYKILPFLTRKKQLWPASITREVYLSFEDALWDLLPRLGYQKGSKFLVPSFYCVDVLNNIREHGYQVSEYEVSKYLHVEPSLLEKAIQKENPDIFVNFDPVGVPSGITEKQLRKLSFRTLVIQDRVHTVVGSSIEHYPESDKHLVLTSYRKVTPFPGTVAIYTRNSRKPQSKFPWKYTLKSLWLWKWYIFYLKLATLIHSVGIANLAVKLLKRHNDLIGDSMISGPLPSFLLGLYDHIAIERIKESKVKQFSIYQDVLSHLLETKAKYLWTVRDSKYNAEKLRGYPLILRARIAEKFMQICRLNGFLTVSELDDSTWSRNQKIFYLPLGPHLKEQDVKKIAEITLKALTGAIQYDTITA